MNRSARLLLVALPLSLAVLDFSLRIFVGRDPSLREFKVPAVPAASTITPPEKIRADLAKWMPGAGLGIAVTTEASTAGGWTLTLLGVFEDSSRRFAVLRAAPAGGGESKRLSVAPGDTVFGLKVAEVGPLSVAFESAQGSKKLELFQRQAHELQAEGSAESLAAQPMPAAAMTPAEPPGAPVPVPAAKQTSPTGAAAKAAPGGAPSGVKNVMPREIKPGEQVKPPWDLPMADPIEYEGSGASK